jgi:oligopeptide/dipeptide ABC transporter ATP-binding protein
LIADEPVSGLDVSIQAKIINLLQEIQNKEDLFLLVISHNLGIIRTIADRVNIMYLGEIVEKGDVSDIFQHPAHPYTKALLSANQIPDPEVENELIQLKEDNPSSMNPPSGCRFHTRCNEYIGDVCEEVHPQFFTESSNEDWKLIGKDHQSKCHLMDQ